MEFSAAKSVGNSKKYICLSMKNRSNIREPLLILPSCQANSFYRPISACFRLCVCVYLCMPLYICIHPHACARGRIFMHVNGCVLWPCCDSYVDNVCYRFPSRHPISHPETANGNVSCFILFFFPFFPEVRNRTLASMWFELGPPKL